MRQSIFAAVAISASMCSGAACASQVQSDAQVKATLIDLETKSWVAWKAHDGAFFDSFLSDDHVEIGPDGAIGKARVLAGVTDKACNVRSYALGDMAFTRLAADTAVLVYRAAQDTMCGTANVPSPVWATSVYVRRGGRWRNAVYEQRRAAH